jgi:hypothetical protein
VTNEQLFVAAQALAPNFRIGVEYVTLPTSHRVLVWHGKKPTDLVERSGGTPFPEGTEFEPKYTYLLQQAVATLQQP